MKRGWKMGAKVRGGRRFRHPPLYGNDLNAARSERSERFLPAERDAARRAPEVEVADGDVELVVLVRVAERTVVPHVAAEADVVRHEPHRAGAQIEPELTVVDREERFSVFDAGLQQAK